MRTPSLRTVLTGALIVVVVTTAGVAGCGALNRSHAAEMLNIAELPASVSGIDCKSYGFTDVAERCGFNIAPADFAALLAGYQYIEPAPCSESLGGVICVDKKEHHRMSHSDDNGPVVGSDFVVAHHYIATPKEFEHGGSVTVLADASRSAVMVDLYIE